MGAGRQFLAFFTHTPMIPEYRNTGNRGQDDSDNIGSIIALDDTSDMAMGSIFDEADKHQHGAVLHWKRDIIRHVYPAALILFDVWLIASIFIIANYIRYDEQLLTTVSRRILLVIEMMSVLGVALIGGYNYRTNTKTFRFVSEHIIVSSGVFIAVFLVIYSVVSYGFVMNSARFVVAVPLIAFPILSMAYRFILGKAKLKYQRGNAFCIIGKGWAAQDLYQRLKRESVSHEVIVIDPFDSDVGEHLIEDDPESPVLESLAKMNFQSSMHGRYVENYVVTYTPDQMPYNLVKRLAVAQFNGNNVCSYDAYLSNYLKLVSPREVNMGWALKGGFATHNNTYDRIKRSLDIAFALIGITVFWPLMLCAALLVKLTSRGPVIFRQERIGLREVPFTLYKFRSMKVRTEEGSMYTEKNDSRLTPIGKFLRKTRIDELPQFWNVLKGDVSLVGPRAEWSELVKGYEEKFPYYHFRHAVKPGITGWAQVNYSYGASDQDTLEKLYYDLYYVRKHGLMLDIIIIIKTIYTVVFGRGQ